MYNGDLNVRRPIPQHSISLCYFLSFDRKYKNETSTIFCSSNELLPIKSHALFILGKITQCHSLTRRPCHIIIKVEALIKRNGCTANYFLSKTELTDATCLEFNMALKTLETCILSSDQFTQYIPWLLFSNLTLLIHSFIY